MDIAGENYKIVSIMICAGLGILFSAFISRPDNILFHLASVVGFITTSFILTYFGVAFASAGNPNVSRCKVFRIVSVVLFVLSWAAHYLVSKG
jgi:uncharacterized membrane protein YdjX (TVP38/TMEM64 family)